MIGKKIIENFTTIENLMYYRCACYGLLPTPQNDIDSGHDTDQSMKTSIDGTTEGSDSHGGSLRHASLSSRHGRKSLDGDRLDAQHRRSRRGSRSRMRYWVFLSF